MIALVVASCAEFLDYFRKRTRDLAIRHQLSTAILDEVA